MVIASSLFILSVYERFPRKALLPGGRGMPIVSVDSLIELFALNGGG